MTFAIIVLCVLGVFVIIFRRIEDKLVQIDKSQWHSEDRISGLEVKDYAQDLRLDAQQLKIKDLNKHVDELGRDIGWSDDRRHTQVLKKHSDDTE
jgi:methylphosphotriester-DNA--protein-cysteine methyltransferase